MKTPLHIHIIGAVLACWFYFDRIKPVLQQVIHYTTCALLTAYALYAAWLFAAVFTAIATNGGKL